VRADVVVLVDELRERCLEFLQVAAEDPEVGELPDDVSVDAFDVSVELGGAGRQDMLDDAELVAESLEMAVELGAAVGLDTLRDAILADLGEQDRGVSRVFGDAQVRPDLPLTTSNRSSRPSATAPSSPAEP